LRHTSCALPDDSPPTSRKRPPVRTRTVRAADGCAPGTNLKTSVPQRARADAALKWNACCQSYTSLRKGGPPGRLAVRPESSHKRIPCCVQASVCLEEVGRLQRIRACARIISANDRSGGKDTAAVTSLIKSVASSEFQLPISFRAPLFKSTNGWIASDFCVLRRKHVSGGSSGAVSVGQT
jgi:hypothetical protein